MFIQLNDRRIPTLVTVQGLQNKQTQVLCCEGDCLGYKLGHLDSAMVLNNICYKINEISCIC